ncbi:MAG: PfkB family carbohydrate kinase [Candidatus Methylomirabilia bacterium]
MGTIVTLEEAVARCAALRAAGKTVVQSHGVFDLIHPGLVRHLEEARRQGDALVVTVAGDRALDKGPVRPIFPEHLRAENAAALSPVDIVCVVDESAPHESLRLLKPDVLAQGQPVTSAERRMHRHLFGGAGAGVDLGATGLYETLELISSSPTLLGTFLDIYPDETRHFLQEFSRRHSFEEVRESIDALGELSVTLVGDAIIDEYHYCRPLGKSAKSNLVVNQYLSHEVFAGGALAIANHLAGICREVRLVTMLGDADPREEFIRAHLRPNVVPVFFRRPDGPTIVKKRYLDQYLNQKLFEVNYLRTQPVGPEIEAATIEYLSTALPVTDLVLVSDYGHGFITAPIIRALERHSPALAINTQNNGANLGYNMITKYRSPTFVCLDELELRWAAQDKEGPIDDVIRTMSSTLDCGCLITTLGKSGSIGVSSDGRLNRTPIFSSKVVDTVGAGDAYFAFTAPLAMRGIPLDVVSFVGNAAGAIAVKIVGNRRPIEKGELLEFVATLLR